MNGVPEITIIIPIYQAAATLETCVGSVLAQTFTDWELLLIDDGSCDDSLERCYKMAEKDARISVHCQNHLGVSAARNKGLDSMRGQYVCFIDADDTVEPNYLAALYEFKSYDMVVCGYFVDYYSEDGVLQSQHTHLPSQVRWNTQLDKQVLVPLFKQGMIHINCNKLLKTGIIKEHQIKYSNYPINEDYIFMLNYLMFSHSLISINCPLYHWRRFKNGISGVCSLPDDILAIYNKGHLLTSEFFDSEVIGNTIMYDSYYLILLKYFDYIIRGKKTKKECWEKLEQYYANERVNDTILTHQCKTLGEKFFFFFHKNHFYKTHYWLYKHYASSL